MKIDYNIIWVDDKIDTRSFKSVIKKIEEFLSEQFFNVTIVTAEDFEEFKEKYNQDIDYDLVITDLNLNNSKGNDVIDFVRLEKNILTEVFFYSANSEVNNTGLANSSRITFFRLDDHNSYNSLQNKLEEVISLTIAKFQHIVAMRGMIMHETSSLDIQIQEILTQIITKGDKEAIVSTIKKKYIKSNSDFNKKIDSVDDIANILLQIGANHRLRAIKRNIFSGDNKIVLEDYEQEIISIRNKFAHAVLEKDYEGNDIFRNKKENIVFNEEYCKKIRKDIIKHKGNLDNLNETLGS